MARIWLAAAIVLVAGTGSAIAQSAPLPLADVALPETDEPDPILKGLVFLDTIEAVVEAGWPGPLPAPVDVSRVPVLGDARIRTMLEAYVGEPFNIVVLAQLRHRVSAYFASIGRPFVGVVLPAQEVPAGIVQVVVVEGRLGSLRIEGNRWFGARLFAGPVGLAPGDTIDARRLDEAVRWINLHTYRRVTPVAESGVEPGTTDLTLRVEDRLPFAVSVSGGNGGTVATGERQYSAAVEWGNVFGRGDTAHVRYTTADDPRAMRQYSGGYVMNLPSRDQFSLSGNVARTAPPLRGAQLFGAAGEMAGITARYTWMGRGARIGVTTMSVAFDWKRSNNDLLFGGESVFTSTAGIGQFVVDVSNRWSSRAGMTTAYVSGTFSPGNYVPDNDDATYDTQRHGATARYAYTRASIDHSAPLPRRFVWQGRATVQLSNARLLSSEQVAFGGDGSIRGLPISSVTRDQGVTASMELQAPPLAGLFRGARPRDQVAPFLFADYGAGWQHAQREAERVSLFTAGVGFRYQVGRFSWTQLSYGWVIEDAGVFGAGRGRLHVQSQISF